MYAGGIKKYIKGNPEAVLMVEFIDTEKSVYEKENKGSRIFSFKPKTKKTSFHIIQIFQNRKEVFEIRKAGLKYFDVDER